MFSTFFPISPLLFFFLFFLCRELCFSRSRIVVPKRYRREHRSSTCLNYASPAPAVRPAPSPVVKHISFASSCICHTSVSPSAHLSNASGERRCASFYRGIRFSKSCSVCRPALVPKYIVPAPAVSYDATPAPTVLAAPLMNTFLQRQGELRCASADGLIAVPAPVVKYVAPATVVFSAAPASTVVVAPAPVVECTSPAPTVDYAAGVPVQYVVPVQHAAPTIPVAGINLNRDGIPNVRQQPHVSLAAPTQCGAPVR